MTHTTRNTRRANQPRDRWALYIGHVDPNHPAHHRAEPVITTHDTKRALAVYEQCKQRATTGEIITLYRNDIPERRYQAR